MIPPIRTFPVLPLPWLLSLALVAVSSGGGARAAEDGERIRLDSACSFAADAISEDIFGFPPTPQEQSLLNEILDHLHLPGIKRKMRLLAANVPNAAAGLHEQKRYLLYNQAFLTKLRAKGKTEWAVAGLFLHEIGHHVNDHVLGGGMRKSHEELEADWYAGAIMKQMGATMEEATAYLAGLAENETSNPKLSARLAAVTNGWTKQPPDGASPPKKPSPAQLAEKQPSRESKVQMNQNVKNGKGIQINNADTINIQQ
jgi:hypothetical protein